MNFNSNISQNVCWAYSVMSWPSMGTLSLNIHSVSLCLLAKEMAWRAEKWSKFSRVFTPRVMEPGFRPRSPRSSTQRHILLCSFQMLLFLALPVEGKQTSFLTKYAPPGRLWPPINTAVAWSYNQNGIWKGNSSWQNEKHIPLNPAPSNTYY